METFVVKRFKLSYGDKVDYISLDEMPWYKECNPLIEGLGYILVEISTSKVNTQTRVRVVISRKSDSDNAIGVDDCAKVHRVLFSRLEALMLSQDVYLEVMSPGMERNIKNAAEFVLFIGSSLRVWSRKKTDWVLGTLFSANPNEIVLELLDSSEKLTIPYDDIGKAKLLNT